MYNVGRFLSLIEFLIEWYYIPIKTDPYVQAGYFLVGLSIVLAASVLRKVAIVQLGRMFYVNLSQGMPSDDSHLRKSGLYSWVRHPTYVGWACYVIGMEAMIGNPFFTFVGAITVWYSLLKRIQDEEKPLVKHYGQKYLEYRKQVPSGIPFSDFDIRRLESLPLIGQWFRKSRCAY